jgi:hypothetical protein
MSYAVCKQHAADHPISPSLLFVISNTFLSVWQQYDRRAGAQKEHFCSFSRLSNLFIHACEYMLLYIYGVHAYIYDCFPGCYLYLNE